MGSDGRPAQSRNGPDRILPDQPVQAAGERGSAFLQSVDRHVLRSYVFLHAIRNGRLLPIGPQDAQMLDSRFTDEDADEAKGKSFDPDDDDQELDVDLAESIHSKAAFEARAADVYAECESRCQRRFNWLRSNLFEADLEHHLQSLQIDCDALVGILQAYGE